MFKLINLPNSAELQLDFDTEEERDGFLESIKNYPDDWTGSKYETGLTDNIIYQMRKITHIKVVSNNPLIIHLPVNKIDDFLTYELWEKM